MTTRTLAAWLKRINQPESWLQPRLSQMSDWSLILERDIVIKRISDEIRAGGLIVIVCDYDVDGCSAGAILTDCIRHAGGRVQILVSSRFLGGYGLGPELTERTLACRPSLVITCDFGSSNHDQIQRLKDNGIDTVVIDHHLVPEVKLPAYGFLNPNRPECPSTFKALCSGGLALSVAGGVLKELSIAKSTIDPSQWIDLAAVASVADVVPLTHDNRAITRAGLQMISEGKRPGFRALLELSKVEPGTALTARDLGFKISPALNAPGRLGPPDIIIDLLLSKDLDEARRIAKEVKEIWDKRRLITDEITQECRKEILDNNYHKQSAIVLGKEGWGHGIVGIAAARIVDEFNLPCAVIGSEGRGSLRGPAGSRLYDALVFSKDTLIKYGGHQAACGMQIDWDRLSGFREVFCQYFKENTAVAPVTEEEFSSLLDLDIRDNLLDLCLELSWLEPCGQGNPRPTIRTSGTIVAWKQVKGNHIKFDLRLPNGNTLPCFQIGNGETQETQLWKKVVVTGDLRKNTWKGRSTAEMFIESVTIIPDTA